MKKSDRALLLLVDEKIWLYWRMKKSGRSLLADEKSERTLLVDEKVWLGTPGG